MSTNPPHAPAARKTGAVLHADLVESVRLNRALGEEAVRRWVAFEHALRGRIVPVHGGHIVKSTGDGFLIAFTSIDHALAAAFGMIMTLAREHVAPDARFHLRIGINWCDYTDAGFDIFGEGVDRAQRLGTVAMPGEVILSQSARSRLAPASPAKIEDLGPRRLKHVDELVPVFRASAPGEAAATRPATEFRTLSPTIAIADIVARGTRANFAMAERIGDDLRRTLSRTVGLSVSSRLSNLLKSASGGQTVPYIVSGAISDATDGEIEIILELAETRSGTLVWQDRFAASVADLRDPDAAALIPVAAEISLHLVEAERKCARGRPFNALESHTLLVSSISLMNGLTPDGFTRARNALETLAETAGRHPTPLAWLAIWHALRRMQTWRGDQGDPQTAHDLALRAMHSASDGDQIAHAATALGLVQAHLLGDAPAALKAYGRALSEAPTDGTALAASALTLACVGEGPAARESALRALNLSPLDPQLFFFQTAAAFAFLASDELETARELAQAAAMNNPNFRLPRAAIAVIACLQGDPDTARDAAQSVGQHGAEGILSALPNADGPTVSAWRDAITGIGPPPIQAFRKAG